MRGCPAGTPEIALPFAFSPSYNKCFMPVFRIHRMKDAPRQQFRNAPHVSGAASVKPKDYEAAGETEADNEYAAWALLRNTEQPLHVGDLLELLAAPPAAAGAAEEAGTAANQPAEPPPPGKLKICKYVGFEEARWFVPEPPPQASLPEPLSAAPPAAAAGNPPAAATESRTARA